MKKKTLITGIAMLGIVTGGMALANGNGAIRVADAIWANGMLYDTVLTPTSFISPPEQSTDMIYNFDMSGLSGQRSVADSAPGDRDYNGGRWSVQMVVFTADGLMIHDPDGDGIVNFELMNEQEVLHHAELGHFEIMPANFYFECPLLPRRGSH